MINKKRLLLQSHFKGSEKSENKKIIHLSITAKKRETEIEIIEQFNPRGMQVLNCKVEYYNRIR